MIIFNHLKYAFCAAFILVFLQFSPAQNTSETITSPNIIHIVADDLGYDDLGCFGSKDIKTPNLDALAKGGTIFSNFYAPHPSCTPTRAALLTGRYAPRVNSNKGINILWPNAKHGLDPEQEISIGHILKEQGYATAVIGKWHLGNKVEYLPNKHGFDYYYGIPYPNDHGPERLGNTGSKDLPQIPIIEDTLVIKRLDNNALAEAPAEFTRKACAFIRQNAAKKKPFFLHFSNIETHTPWFVPKGFNGYSQAGEYGDAVEYLDRTVGIIISQLKKSKIRKNTLIVFTSDNGPLVHKYPELEACYGKFADVDTARASQRVLFEGKYQARFEGGARVSCIMNWPDKIPANLIKSEIIDGTDLFTTFVKLAGGTIPEDRQIDGKDIKHLIFETNNEKAVRDIFYSFQGDGVLTGVRYKNWKLAVPAKKTWAIAALQNPMLFDLSLDPKEQNNIADKYPKELKLMLQLAEVGRKNIASNKPLPVFISDIK